MSHDVVIPMVCSENYLEKAFSLINSIEDNSDLNYKIHLHLVNISPLTLATLSSKYKLNMSRVECFHDFPEMIAPNKLLRVNPIFGGNIYTRFSAYCANSRVLDFKKLLYRGESKILYMDVDSIVRSSLIELSSIIDDNDISIHLRRCLHHPVESHKMLNPGGCAAGIIGIRNSPSAIEFVDKWASLLMTEERLLHWYSEQNTANHLFVHNHYDMKKLSKADPRDFARNPNKFTIDNPAVKVYNLEQKWIDWNFKPDSPIWVGKGKKKGYEKYQKEELSYLRQ